MHCNLSTAWPRSRRHRARSAGLAAAFAVIALPACTSSGLDEAAATTQAGQPSGASGATVSTVAPSQATGASGTSGLSGVTAPWDDPTNTTTPGMLGPDASVPLTTGALPIDPPVATMSEYFQSIGYGEELSDCYQKAYGTNGEGPVDSNRIAKLATEASEAVRQGLLKCDRKYPKQFPTTTPMPAATAPTAPPTTTSTSSGTGTTTATTAAVTSSTTTTATTGR